MSLRIRLFLVFGALVALLIGAHAFLVRSLASEMTAELDLVALDVGASVARALAEIGPLPEPTGTFSEGDVVMRFGPGEPKVGETTWVSQEVQVDLSADESDAGAPGGDRHVIRRVVHRIEKRRVTLPPAAGGPAAPSPAAPGPVAAPPSTAPAPAAGPAAGNPAAANPSGKTEPPAGGGFAYVFATRGDGSPSPGAAGTEALVLQLGDHAKGALQLRAPGLTAEVPIPRLGLEEKLARFERKVLFGSLLLFLAGLLAAALLAHRVSAPLLRLSRAAVAVGDGQLGLEVDERASDAEVRSALGAFNRMSSRLRELDGQNRRLQQERHLGEIGEIARGLAHSLRNPLHALGLSLDELAQRAAGGRDEDETALLAAARRQIGRLDRSIRSFLVFASRTGVEPAPVDLGALAEDVALEALQHQHQGVRLAVENEAGERPTLPAVEQELRAMVQALVVNAVEASPPGGQVVVRVGRDPVGRDPGGREEAESGRFWLEVDDQGPGLDPAVRDRLFTPHVTTKASGSGMGLFLAQRLAAGRYDGRLELSERPAGGTRARLELGPRTEAGA